MTLVLFGLPFFRSIGEGWITYYNRSSGPKFTEEQLRMADDAAANLNECFPVDYFLDPITHSEVCRSLANENFVEASKCLEQGPPELDLRKATCHEALRIGVWLLGACAPESIRLATFNLLACEYYFPTL